MTYSKTIEYLNKIYSAEIEKARFSDPTKTANLDHGELTALKNQAVDSEKGFRKKIELKQIIDINDHENYFSKQYEKKKEIFMELVESNELYETFLEERQEAATIGEKAVTNVNKSILEARQKINEVLEDTKKDVQSDLDKIKEIEINENYLLRSRAPIEVPYLTDGMGGLPYYVDYIDMDIVSGDEYTSLSGQKRVVKPILKYIGSSHRYNFRFNNLDIRKEILKGVDKYESNR